ncbi:MAG: sulfatase [Bacteroidota bacterium]
MVGKYWFLLCSIILGCLSCSTDKQVNTSPQQPNILFILTDDHAYHAIGAYGERLANLNPTPHLDALAKDGMLFRNVFCNNSICTPSRASILTGQYPQTNGVLDLDGALPADRQYLPIEMKKLGYQTAIIGKWHLKEAPDAFDYYKVLPVQGKYFDPIFITKELGDRREVIDFHGGIQREVNISNSKGHSSDVITDLTLDWLESRPKKDQPFFLMHHYKAPHDDFEYAPRYEDYLADAQIPEPASLYEQPLFGSVATLGENGSLKNRIGTSVSDRHPYRSYTAQYGFQSEDRKQATSNAYQEYLKRYLRCVKGVDDNLGRLFQYLKDNGLWENTIVVYTSDQGMMLGEHDYMDKRWMYEESMRMPLLMHLPEKVNGKEMLQGQQSNLLINNTDFAPTLIELAGGVAPGYMQGKSFAAALEGKSIENWRSDTYYRYWMHMVHHDIPAHLGIRSQDHKLIYYYGEHYDESKNGTGSMWWLKDGCYKIEPTPKAWEFYDLQKDPRETVNRIDEPAYADIVEDMKKRLKHIRKELKETDEKYPHLQEVIEANW